MPILYYPRAAGTTSVTSDLDLRWAVTAPSAAAPAHVQSATGQSGTNATSTAATFTTTPTAGHLLVAIMGGDKAQTITSLSGWSDVAKISTASVCLYFAWKVSAGNETTVTVSHTTSVAGNELFIGEYDAASVPGSTWVLSGSANLPSDEVARLTAATGTTAATTYVGLGIAAVAIDTSTNATAISWSNSYATRWANFSAGGRGVPFVAEHTEPQGTTATTTMTITSGAGDQLCGAIGVFTKLGGTGTTQVTSDLDLRWKVAQQVTSDADLRWLVAQRVNADHDLRWAVRSTVTSDLDARWAVRSLVTSDADLRWRVSQRLSSDLDARWAVRSTVTSDSDLRWRVYGRVTSDADLRWAVISSITQVTSDVDLRWRVSSRVNSDHDLRWAVRAVTQSDADLRWRVLNRVTSDVDLRWKVISSITQITSDVDLRWRSFALIVSDADLRWAVRSLVASDLNVPWRVSVRLSSDLDLRWALRGTATADLELLWRVRDASEVVSGELVSAVVPAAVLASGHAPAADVELVGVLVTLESGHHA